MKKSLFFASLALLLTVMLQAQPVQRIERVEPPSWWIGMKNPDLQLMVYGKGISGYDVSTLYPGLSISTVVKTENPNYLFINLKIDGNCKPGNPSIIFTRGKEKILYNYTLLQKSSGQQKGFNTSDVIYLVMPDRFSNGDPSNDKVDGMYEGPDRKDPNGRHGGDLKGISDHLSYMKDLGVTGLWLNPFLENNQLRTSYHGYAITNFYRVDPRYGTNDEFRQLVTDAHSKGMKVMMDMIFNHCGSEHWMMKDLPCKDWVHQFSTFTRTNYRASTYIDPYAADCDREIMEKGWFDLTMPDLNQSNPLVENYLIQNSLWWIGFSDLDGIRMDTYPYPEKNMMSRWAKRVTDEYPGFFIVGEVWYQHESFVSYWSLGKKNTDGYESNLPSVMDFPFSFATHRAFVEPQGDVSGISLLYNVLAQDFLYPDPFSNVIFLDNHDLTRYFTQTGKRPEVYKMAMAFLLTTRGIPQIYYGTEILTEGDKSMGDGYIRTDFPGGWPGDARNCFSTDGMTATEKDAYLFTRNLLNWRKSKEVIHTGKLKQFIPENNLYVYSRYNNNESVLVVLNNSEKEPRVITRERYGEAMEGYSSGYEVISGKIISDLSSFTIAPKTAMIIELKK